MSFKPYGIITPVVTPFNEDGSINYAAYRKVIRNLINNGIHGIFPFGTTGEFYAVNDDEYRKVIELTVEEASGKAHVYVGANHITTRGVIHLAEICGKIKGVDALSVLTPMFVSSTQEELYRYYRDIAGSTDLPIVMYNNAPKTNITIEPATAARLSEISNIVAVKDSTGNFTNTEEYIRQCAENDFSVLVGKDTLIYAGLCMGASGAIASCSNIAPKMFVDLYESFAAGNMDMAKSIQMKINPLRLGCNMGSFPAAIKACLVQQGFDVGRCLPPIQELTKEQNWKLHSTLAELGLL